MNLQSLAQACLNGLVGPNSFVMGQTWTPGYADTPQELPGQFYYLDDSASSAIASALGASVVKLPPFDVPPGTQIPGANWIQFSDGSVELAANIANECNLSPSIPNMSSLCGMQQLLSYAIPQGTLDPSCSPNLQVAGTVLGSAPQNPVAVTGGYGLQPLTPAVPKVGPPVTTLPPAGLTPSQTVTTGAPTAPASGASGGNGGGGGGAPSPVTYGGIITSPASPTAPPSATLASGCFNPLSAWLSMDSCLGPLGIIEWGVLALGAVLLLSHGGRR
jgi:hypothetical protein